MRLEIQKKYETQRNVKSVVTISGFWFVVRMIYILFLFISTRLIEAAERLFNSGSCLKTDTSLLKMCFFVFLSHHSMTQQAVDVKETA